MKKSSLRVEDMETILNSCTKSARSTCVIEADSTLTIQFTYRCEDFTVVGINRDEYRDAQSLYNLGCSLIEEIEAAINMNRAPPCPQRNAG
ncbi:hypothetical protein LCGC14_0030430 [marine sediment metagenome]